MSEKNISESKKSLKEEEEVVDTAFEKEIEPDTENNNDISENNNDATENNNDKDNPLKEEEGNADGGEGKDQKNESGEEEKGSDKVENGDGNGNENGNGNEMKNSSGSRRSSIRNSKSILNNENGEKTSGSQQKLDEKKSWLPDINKSQNISTYNLDDNTDSSYTFKTKKDKENSDPYNRKNFHMKYQNPFKVSFDITDNNKDLFKLRELERKKQKQEKERQRKLHIYEKNLPKNRNFRELLEDDEDDKLYYQKLKKRNSELILLNQQKRSDRQFGKESLSSFIEKKREMFLLQYSLGVKRDEIKKLEDIIQAEEQKLLEDEKALEEDERKFDAFLRENDDNSVKAIKQAEAETKLKLEKCQEIKKLNQQIMSIRSDMSKNEDLLKDYRRYRQFLESITPESWFEEQEKIYGHSIKYIEKKKTSTESLETPKNNTTTTATTKNPSNNGTTTTSGKRKSNNNNNNNQSYRAKDNKEEEIINEFEEYLNTDETNEPCLLYFTEPKQLLDIFAELEENNLALIQNCQESEESLEILKLQMKESNEKMDSETQQLKQQIEDLNDAISREEEKARQLEEKTIIFNSGGNEGEESQEYLLEELNKKVKDVYKKCIGDNDANLSTLQMLTNVENRLEQLFEMIELMPPDKVEQAEKIKDKERRQRLREEKLGAQISLQEEKVRKSLERARAPIKKKLGKPVAFRSVIPQKVKKQTKETNEIQKDDLDYYW